MSEDAPVNTGAVAWPDDFTAGVMVRRMQAKLHRWAGEDPSRRFGDLFNLVYDPAFLVYAWERVSTNKGARTAGIDKATAAMIETSVGVVAFLGQIRDSLKSGEFGPVEVRRVMIPKANGKLRRLGIPTIADRVVQASLKLVLEPIFEADFKPCSYGFRPNRRAQDAIAEIHYFASGARNYQWVLECDIKACFDEISHTALIDRLRARIKDKRVCTLVKAFLKSGVLTELGDREETLTGTPQGGVITPPTQRATSVSRSRWVTGGWSAAGERRAAGDAGRAGAVSGRTVQAAGFRLLPDIICSIFMSCLGIAARVPRSTRRMSTRPRACWRPALRPLTRPARWPGGWAARSGRPAAMSPWLRNRAGSRFRRRPRCSPSGFPSGWAPPCGSTPGRPGARSRRSPRRPWRNSSAVLTGTVRAGEGAAGGDGARLLPPCRRGNVGGLRDIGAAAAGQDRRPRGGRRQP